MYVPNLDNQEILDWINQEYIPTKFDYEKLVDSKLFGSISMLETTFDDKIFSEFDEMQLKNVYLQPLSNLEKLLNLQKIKYPSYVTTPYAFKDFINFYENEPVNTNIELPKYDFDIDINTNVFKNVKGYPFLIDNIYINRNNDLHTVVEKLVILLKNKGYLTDLDDDDRSSLNYRTSYFVDKLNAGQIDHAMLNVLRSDFINDYDINYVLKILDKMTQEVVDKNIVDKKITKNVIHDLKIMNDRPRDIFNQTIGNLIESFDISTNFDIFVDLIKEIFLLNVRKADLENMYLGKHKYSIEKIIYDILVNKIEEAQYMYFVAFQNNIKIKTDSIFNILKCMAIYNDIKPVKNQDLSSILRNNVKTNKSFDIYTLLSYIRYTNNENIIDILYNANGCYKLKNIVSKFNKQATLNPDSRAILCTNVNSILPISKSLNHGDLLYLLETAIINNDDDFLYILKNI